MAIDAAADNDVRMDMGALWLALRRRLLRILLVTAVLLAATYAALLFVPKSYDATAGILVESRDNVYTRPTNDTTGVGAPSPDALAAIISSQIELIKSRDTLLAVVRSEKLTDIPEFNGTAKSSLSFLTRFFKKPSIAADEDTAVNILADHLLATRERDSAVINVQVSSTDPALAARLANAVAQADVSRRAGLTLSDTADASQWLDQQITPLRQRVADAEDKVASFKVDNDLYTTGANSTSLLDQQMAETSTQIIAAQERQNTAQSRSTLIRGLLAAGQPIDGVDDVRNSVTIQQLVQQKAQLTSQRAQLLATLLPTHPTVEAVTAQVAAIDKQISLEGRRVADALDAEAKIEDSVRKSLQGNLDALKTKAADATRQNVTLDGLTREANADRDLLQTYLSRYRDATSRTDANSDLPDVRVLTLAVPATTPSSPRTTLILGAVAFVSLAVQIGAVLFGELLSGRALTDPRIRPAIPDESEDEVPSSADLPANAVWRRVDPLTHEMAAAPDEPEPIELATVEPEPEPEVAETRRESRGLRSWFSKRARSVGVSLTAFEPPMSGEDASARLQSVAAAAPEPVVATLAENAAPAEPGDASFDFSARSDIASADPDNQARLADLSADLILGRARIVLLAALDDHRDSEALSEQLIDEVLHRGLSIARVDAGSGRPSTEPGITDLSTERAGFGDVVHKTAEEGLAEIPWGHLTTMDRRSTRPITLVEALSDIYEVVLVLTGRVGMASTLPLFAGLPCRLVLVTNATPDLARVDAARSDFSALGFDAAEVIGAPALEAEVA
ncbi:MAG: GumC family protein [Devosia sp.]